MTPKESDIFETFVAGKFKVLVSNLASIKPTDYAFFEEVWMNDKNPYKLDILAVRRLDVARTNRPELQALVNGKIRQMWELGRVDSRNYYKFDSGERAWAIEVGEWCDYHHFGEIHNVKRLMPKRFPKLVVEGYAVVCRERMDSGDILGMYEDDGVQVFQLT